MILGIKKMETTIVYWGYLDSKGRRTLTDTAHANLQTSEVTRSQLSARQPSGNTYASRPATHAKSSNNSVKNPPAQLHAAEM